MSNYGTPEFWNEYEGYVQESLPRHLNARDQLMATRANNRPYGVVLDLGCGRLKEARDLFSVAFEVDSDPAANPDAVVNYRDTAALALKLPSMKGVDGFTSLFSAECTGTIEANQELYEWLFKTFKTLKFGVVAGFYYRGKEAQFTVEETGGLTSYQSVGPLSKSTLYKETRLQIEAPSKLFGPDVIEVWKLLERR